MRLWTRFYVRRMGPVHFLWKGWGGGGTHTKYFGEKVSTGKGGGGTLFPAHPKLYILLFQYMGMVI